uniref:Uncharacterized protein n=1 Tax=Siphoviridae sp. ctZHD14 TaxID=2827891 RepID=A0A8S5SW20_9CAUD|nr:MAG TPA: hypothetical protein [Siphoviridae sp. ctZHD14]
MQKKKEGKMTDLNLGNNANAKYIVVCFDNDTELFGLSVFSNLENAIAELRDTWWDQMCEHIDTTPLDLVLDGNDDYEFVSHVKSPDERKLFEVCEKDAAWETIIGWLDLDNMDAAVALDEPQVSKYYTIRRVEI